MIDWPIHYRSCTIAPNYPGWYGWQHDEYTGPEDFRAGAEKGDSLEDGIAACKKIIDELIEEGAMEE